MTDKKVELGTVVKLKSGGPLMTVNDFHGSGAGNRFQCAWFAKDGSLQTGVFGVEALEIAD